MTMILATLVALGVLIAVHEFGHFYVARRCGVKVLTYSIGFGPTIWSRTGSDGCQYRLAALPLGGYVRMLDSREGQVPPELLPVAFDQKPVAQRAAIVAAGPGINFLFAIVIYAVLAGVGSHSLAPIVGQVTADSPAALANLQSGEEIVSVDGTPVQGWQEVGLEIISDAGEAQPVILGVRQAGATLVQNKALDVSGLGGELADPLSQLGIQPWRPQAQLVLSEVAEGAAADAAGLQPGDRIVAIDGESMSAWDEVVEIVSAAEGQTLSMTVERAGTELALAVTPQAHPQVDGRGYMGAAPVVDEIPEDFLRFHQDNPLQAVISGVERTWQMSALTLEAMWKMVSGVLSTANLSGPITIAKVATASAESGWLPYLAFVAYLSVSLGVLNLLPIPVLDGGHLAWFAVEAVRGKPVSEHIQAMGVRVGMSLVMALMVVAFYNDLTRL